MAEPRMSPERARAAVVRDIDPFLGYGPRFKRSPVLAFMQLPYDPELQMFKQEAREPSLERLGFMRWLAERDQLEHEVFGQPGGVYARLVQKPAGSGEAGPSKGE